MGLGTGVGTALGLGARHTLLFVVIPILSGGVGEGAIPLSMGYADILHRKQGDIMAQVLPSVMLGSLTAGSRPRKRLSQRAGRHGRRGHPHRREPHAVDALRPDRDPCRRRYYRDTDAPGIALALLSRPICS